MIIWFMQYMSLLNYPPILKKDIYSQSVLQMFL